MRNEKTNSRGNRFRFTMHLVCLSLGGVFLAVYAPALMADAPSPWFFLLFPWFICFLLVVLENAIITAISISSMTGASSKGKTIPWGIST